MIQTPGSVRIERFRFVAFDGEATQPAPEKDAEALAAQSATVFSADILEPLMEALPPAPSFSEQEMEEAKVVAYQQGQLAGMEEAQAKAKLEAAQAAAAHNSLLEVIANRVTLAAEEHAHYLQSQQEVLAKTAIGIARKVAGDALKREPYAHVESLLKDCMELVAGSPEIVINVSAARVEGLRQSMDLLQRHLQDFHGKLSLAGDETMGEHDCRVIWKTGHAHRDQNILWNDIETLIRRSILTS